MSVASRERERRRAEKSPYETGRKLAFKEMTAKRMARNAEKLMLSELMFRVRQSIGPKEPNSTVRSIAENIISEFEKQNPVENL